MGERITVGGGNNTTDKKQTAISTPVEAPVPTPIEIALPAPVEAPTLAEKPRCPKWTREWAASMPPAFIENQIRKGNIEEACLDEDTRKALKKHREK